MAPTSPPTQRRYTKRKQEKEAEYYFYALVKRQHNHTAYGMVVGFCIKNFRGIIRRIDEFPVTYQV